jgi:small-conductance mechanosensitive channel
MEDLIEAVKAWPVIVQGALGSGLFWLILFIGQKFATSVAGKYSNASKKARLSWLVSEQAKCFANMAKSHEESARFATIILYRASRHVIRAVMWIALGLISSSIISALETIGFIGALYYLFKAYEIVAPIDDEQYNEERLKQLTEERERLKA